VCRRTLFKLKNAGMDSDLGIGCYRGGGKEKFCQHFANIMVGRVGYRTRSTLNFKQEVG